MSEGPLLWIVQMSFESTYRNNWQTSPFWEFPAKLLEHHFHWSAAQTWSQKTLCCQGKRNPKHAFGSTGVDPERFCGPSDLINGGVNEMRTWERELVRQGSTQRHLAEKFVGLLNCFCNGFYDFKGSFQSTVLDPQRFGQMMQIHQIK